MKKKTLTNEQLIECAKLKKIFVEKQSELGLTQEKAAAALGMNQGSFSHYLNGRNALNVEFASKVARLLKVNVVDFSVRLQLEIYNLATANADIPGVSAVRKNLAFEQILKDSKLQDGEMYKMASSFPVGSWEMGPVEVEKYRHLNEKGLYSTVDAGPRSYWIEVIGPSMAASRTPSFPEGTMVLIDKDDFELTSGKFYVARRNNGETTFKQLVIDSGRSFLVSLNGNFPPMELTDDWEIVGKAVDARIIDL
jgi:SOS-response transcriptional repressor LexA